MVSAVFILVIGVVLGAGLIFASVRELEGHGDANNSWWPI
jgi:hypothetical protein